ncbi:hypothetical protein [Mastigocladopsis repens]|nr:hypothetical protein [Mastigocladopsis repens]
MYLTQWQTAINIRNEPPRRASAAGGFPSAGDWRRQERQGTEEYLLSANL